MNTFTRALEPLSGYLLPAMVAVVLPEAGTNLITNPSLEIDTTGYSAVGAGAAIARVATQQRRGAYSLQVTPAAAVASGAAYTVSVTDGQYYTFSVDLKGKPGKVYYLEVFETSRRAYKEFTATGYWQRLSLTLQAKFSSAATILRVVRNAYAGDTTPFFLDGFQFENKPYPTTYIDGDLHGFIATETAYLWTGTAHASTSTRASTTRAGGRVVNLAEYGFELTSMPGLGLAGADHYGLETSLDRAFYLSSTGGARKFALTGELSGPDFASFMRRRNSLEDALRYNRSRIRQPLALVVTLRDAADREIGEPLTISAVYEGGLEGEMESLYSERLALKFTAYDPALYADGESGAGLDWSDGLTMNYYLQRSALSVWSAPGTALNAALTRFLYRPEDGKVYAIGLFTKTAAPPRYRGFSKWSGTDWEELCPTAPTTFTAVRAIAKDAAGNLYIGGRFTGYNGVANTNHIAKFDGAVYTPLGTGVTAPATPDVNAIAIDPATGLVYVGGNIDQVNGAVTVGELATYDPGTGTWAQLGGGGGLGAAVDSLLWEETQGRLWIGMNGSIGRSNYVTAWQAAFYQPGTFYNGTPIYYGFNGRVLALAKNPITGAIVAGGAFTTRYYSTKDGTTQPACRHIAMASPNGFSFTTSEIGGGVDGDVSDIWFDADGNMYIAGAFDECGGVSGFNGLAMWNGSAWVNIGLEISGAPANTAFLIDPSGRMHLGSSAVQTVFSTGQVTVVNDGQADAYPEFRFTGPGTIAYLANVTTGAVLNLALTLVAGEVAVLRLDPAGMSLVSSIHGDRMSALQPGSTLPFTLQPGENTIALFISGPTAATGAAMYWKEAYLSLAGGVR